MSLVLAIATPTTHTPALAGTLSFPAGAAQNVDRRERG